MSFITSNEFNLRNNNEIVDVLGTLYKIQVKKRSEDAVLLRDNADCYCLWSRKLIVIADTSDKGEFPDFDGHAAEMYAKQLLRHELIHAFLYESGLYENSLELDGGWATNEEMVDWMTIQLPKMIKVFQQCEAV